MTCRIAVAVVGLGLAGILAQPVLAAVNPQAGRLDPKKVIELSEQAIGRHVGNYQLTDTTGARFSLRDYRGKPLVISLVYTACSSVCPPTTQHLISAVEEASRVFGPDSFNVLTVGFDARNDTPTRMAQFASVQGVKAKNWRLASADSATVDALLRDLGFSYVAIAGGFDHITQTTIIDRDGKVYRSIYGEEFPLQIFIEPLKGAVYGTASSFSMGGLLDRIKFICTVYDPGAGRYRIDYGTVFGGVIGALSLLVVGGLIYREWHRIGRA
ncbi:MAG: SCO family protein [Pseudolabrys sp.]|nr:SCO family protein [Pseudolabrys sp.]